MPTLEKITLQSFISSLRSQNYRCTFLGVGPVSEMVVRATFEACKQNACPPIFIASRNQVDLKSLGHGYLMGGMDQFEFVELLNNVKDETGYDGPVYIARDHGGPWQRNVELDEKYPVDKAMEIARQSFRADIEAGFNCLHIDPTKCPFSYTQDELCEWTADLLEYCEAARKDMGKEPIDYEVGTEDIQGGLTSMEAFESFLKKLSGMLKDKNLPLPTFVVGQTGTLTRADRNIGHFDRNETAELASIAAKYGIGFKEHNGDYLSIASCRIHRDLGITGMNVAPEFGLVETRALLELADLEAKLLREGWICEKDFSDFRNLILELTFKNTPWRKWMEPDVKKLPDAEIENNTAIRELIAEICGHYTYGMDEVINARKILQKNIERFALVENSDKFVFDKVMKSIEFYIKPFGLAGINALIN